MPWPAVPLSWLKDRVGSAPEQHKTVQWSHTLLPAIMFGCQIAALKLFMRRRCSTQQQRFRRVRHAMPGKTAFTACHGPNPFHLGQSLLHKDHRPQQVAGPWDLPPRRHLAVLDGVNGMQLLLHQAGPTTGMLPTTATTVHTSRSVQAMAGPTLPILRQPNMDLRLLHR